MHAKEFVSVAFSPQNENHIITLSGEPDWNLIFWKWDKINIEAYTKIDPIGPIDGMAHISF